MRRYRRAIPLAGLVLAAAIGGTLLFAPDFRGHEASQTSSAAALPTACENFAQVSALFAGGGSAAALAMTGGQVFTRDAQADSKQILKDLIDSCDAELAARGR